MKINGTWYRTIWSDCDKQSVNIIDQSILPHKFYIENIPTALQMVDAIASMRLRGAGLIGAAGGYGVYLASLEVEGANWQKEFFEKVEKVEKARPTAVNLSWAVKRMVKTVEGITDIYKVRERLFLEAEAIADEDAAFCKRIGSYGVSIIEEIYNRTKKPVNILTHCNAGWLAFVDYGTATAPIYEAHDRGIPVHVWVDETRPVNQGARLTAFELLEHGVPHTIIADNVGGHLMQHGQVDMVIVGSDRTTRTGDVCNKIGTYLKAIAAFDNQVPFYAAMPSSTIDWSISDGLKEIPIEERSGDELKYAVGKTSGGELVKILLTPEKSQALNFGFDVTPSRLVAGIITERGIAKASLAGLRELYPEKYC